jgi:AmmeMemoRadiSam system protein B
MHAAFARANVAVNAAVWANARRDELSYDACNYETAAINFHWPHGGGIHTPHHHAPIDIAGECRNVSTKIRPPAVAGLFYPGDPIELRDAISEYSAQAPTAAGPAPKALIVPHAGYIYSGVIAAAAYSQVAHQRRRISRIVLIGPSHRVYLRGMAVPAAEVFKSPLGMVAIDRELKARALTHEHVVESDAPHANEHSLEVQLPFLQVLFDEFTLLLALGSASPPSVAAVLAAVWGDEETLVLVSSDLSHYLPYEQACAVDAETSAAILRNDATLRGEQACGCIGINGLSFLAGQRNARIAQIARCNSGDTAGDRNRVVGYGAFALHESRPATTF